MSSNSMIVKLKVLNELQEYWELNDPVIPEGYAAYVDGSASGQIKIGNGRSKYSELDFTNFTGGAGSTAASIGLATDEEYTIGVSDIVAPTVRQVKIDINNLVSQVYTLSENIDNIIFPTIPTNVSELINDSGYITSSDIPTNISSFVNDSNYATVTEVNTKQDNLTAGTNITIVDNVIRCTSVASNDVYTLGTSVTLSPSVAQVKSDINTLTTSLMNLSSEVDILQEQVIPTNISTLVNDAGYITSSDIPTTVSSFANDMTYVTLEVLNNRLSSVYSYKGSIASRESLPTDASVGDVYNLEDTGMNVAWNGTKWDDLGATIDMSNYVTTVNLLSYLNEKQDRLTAGTDISIVDNVISYNGTRLFISTEEEWNLGTSITVVPSIKQVKDAIADVRNDIPTNISYFNNDVGYITINSVPTKVSQLTNDLAYVTYNAIPKNTSQLVNDSSFVTSLDISEKQNNLTPGENIIIADDVISFSGIATDEEFNEGTSTTKVPSVEQVKTLEARIVELEKLLGISALTDT